MTAPKQATHGNTAPLAIRMPESLHDAVREAAHQNRRSLNAELVMRLELSFEIEGPRAPDHPILAGHARPGPPPRVLSAAELAERAAPAYDDPTARAQLAELLARLSLADRAVALRVLQALVAAGQ